MPQEDGIADDDLASPSSESKRSLQIVDLIEASMRFKKLRSEDGDANAGWHQPKKRFAGIKAEALRYPKSLYVGSADDKRFSKEGKALLRFKV